jgi:ATP-binding cassette, subfamily B, bacterial
MRKASDVSFREILREYGRALYPHALVATLALISATLLQVTSIALPVYVSRFINEIALGKEAQIEMLEHTLWIFSLLLIAQWVFRRATSIALIKSETRVMHDLYAAAFRYLLGHSQHFFASQFSGTLTRRISKYVHSFEILFDALILTFLQAAIYIGGAIVVLSLRHPLLGGALLLWSLVFIGFQTYATWYQKPIRVRRAESDSRLVGGFADAITNQQSIQLFASLRHEMDRIGRFLTTWRQATNRSWMVSEYVWAAQGAVNVVLQIGLFFGALVLWRKGQLSPGDFVLIQIYVIIIIDHLVSVTQVMRRVSEAVADGGEMVAILKEPHGIVDAPGARDLVVEKGGINFEKVTFSYADGKKPILQDFSLAIVPGQKVGLVGKSGTGKSTVLRLLLRHHDITKGRIEIDGQSIQEVTQDSLHKAIAVVPQEPLLFHRSITENIAYGKEGAGEEEVTGAAEKAHAHAFIEQLPQGYASKVGERGIKLSGGERQRIAIARAILKDARVLLLDEATSSLDSESEVMIQAALKSLMRGKTVIAVAHRLSTLREMDRILVIDGGAIVEDGTHDELLSRGGIYAELWAHQAGGFIE